MKKTLFVIAAILGFAVVASAQPRAIGVRAGYGGELSYQHDLGGNFLEADLGFLGGNGFYVTGVYDFVFASADIFNFYAGPGAQLGFWNGDDESGFNLGIVGQIGAEVEIPSVPLNISLDWRPGFSFIHGGFYGAGVGLGLRYRF
ncbi:MAG: hypothetical protein IJ578_01205 [Bacteroidales bacterium]|nr:hypothetical protein [Bacteroidales bacterium]MBR1706487.1 hypothetical protein [Bacteroidales bacterium]